MEPEKIQVELEQPQTPKMLERDEIPTHQTPKKRANFADDDTAGSGIDTQKKKKKIKKKEKKNKLVPDSDNDEAIGDFDYIPIEDEKKKKKKKTSLSSSDSGTINRVFSESDEISILQGMIDFRNEMGFDPNSDITSLLNYLQKSRLLGLQIRKLQLKEKIRRLKKKFQMYSASTSAPKTSAHLCKFLQLSNIMWGQPVNNLLHQQPKEIEFKAPDPVPTTITTATTSADDVKEKSIEDRNSDGEKLRLSRGVVEALKEMIRVEEGRYDDFESMYPYLNVALEREGGKLLFLRKWSSIGVDELEEMETKFEKVAMMELKARRHAARAIDELHTKWLAD